MDRELLEAHGLGRLANDLARFEKPAIAFRLLDRQADRRSKLGGLPLLPPGFTWPRSKKRPLDFLLQVDLSDLASIEPTGLLPTSGLLTFFYDLDNQPWGYDPAELDGFRIELIRSDSLEPYPLPSPTFAVGEHPLAFGPAVTLPHFGSRAYEQLESDLQLSNTEADQYFEYLAAFEARFYAKGAGYHRLFGHSANVQGDMQLEAQLVTNGLYCGDPSGYHDPRAKVLERGAEDWVLLLQLDTDDGANLMWGDSGMLYYWLRIDDLLARRFDRAWMTLQCY